MSWGKARVGAGLRHGSSEWLQTTQSGCGDLLTGRLAAVMRELSDSVHGCPLHGSSICMMDFACRPGPVIGLSPRKRSPGESRYPFRSSATKYPTVTVDCSSTAYIARDAAFAGGLCAKVGSCIQKQAGQLAGTSLLLRNNTFVPIWTRSFRAGCI